MKKTPIFIISIIVLIAAYDVFIITTEGKTQSISAYLIRWSHEYPSMTFSFGFTFGHLFWRMRASDIWNKITKKGDDHA